MFGADMIMSDFLRDEDLCSTLQKEIIPLIDVRDFEGMYKVGGRPPVSPRILLMVTVFQFLEGLSDRAAAFNLRYRIDWKIALGLELDDKGIHYSLLSRFRDRLLDDEQASYAFDKVLEYLTAIGLVKKGSKQRIDSTHVIGQVRELSRLELLHETIRLFCIDAKPFRDRMDQLLVEDLEKYFGKVSIYRLTGEEKDQMIKNAGLAMRSFIAWAEQTDSAIVLRTAKSYDTMKTVFTQNFEDKGPDDTPPKLIKIATGRDHICSPHEPEARYANKGGKGWLGYKAQIAETVSEPGSSDGSNFITFAEVAEATDHDGGIIEEYYSDQAKHNIEPSEVYADTHYNTESNIESLATEGINLKGPVVPMPKQDRTKSENRGFIADVANAKVTCPVGNESNRFSHRAQNKISATFAKNDCQDCNQKQLCKPAPRGKNILIKLESKTLTDRRQDMTTLEFRRDMYKRNGIEGTLSGLVRGQRMRHSRYRGKSKLQFQVKCSAASANIKRLHNYRQNADAA